MIPGSELRVILSASEDHEIDYRIMAGNTAVCIDQQEKDAGTGLFGRIVRHHAPRPLALDIATLAFFGSSNDLSVSVTSIKSVPVSGAVWEDIVCDHLTYFSSAKG